MKTMNKAPKKEMCFTLVTAKGKVMRFFLRSAAELYQRLEGGVIVTKDVLKVSEYKEIA